MAMIPDEEITRIKEQTDLAAVIRARGVELKPQGGDLVGLCPFHDDHDPSMRVTPGKGLWRCMSCGATGNVIQFVQRFDGVSFRHAYELLKGGGAAAFTGAPTCQPMKKATIPRLPSPVKPDMDDQAALRQVLDYYHERLRENPPALAYLKKRGIAAEAIDVFKLGFVDRTLGLRLPHNNRKEGAAIRERLSRLGILRDTGHEHLRGRVVFPVIAESGEIGTVYGRAIDDGGKHDRHLFLPGPQRGIWNAAALRSPEVILTEGIIDALSFWSAGFRHVTTGYSAKAVPDELLDALIEGKVQRVLIAYDRDEAGDRGAAETAAQLTAHGIECARVLFPHGQDANAYALSVQPADGARQREDGVVERSGTARGEAEGTRAGVPSGPDLVHKSLGLLLRSAVPFDGTGKGKVSSHVAPALFSFIAAKAANEIAALRVPAPVAVRVAEVKPEPLAPARVSETPKVETPAVNSTAIPQKAAKKETPAEAVATIPAQMVPVSALPQTPVEVLKNEQDETELGVGDRRYRVRGLLKNTGFESLRVSIKAIYGERWHLDTLDLCSARQREAFVLAASVETTLKPELLKRDLGKVLGKLEELQEARLKAEAAPQTQGPEMDPAEKEAALALLRDPRLLDRILNDFAACGVVGEETNKLVGYLAAVSRKLDAPLAVIVQSTSAAGKTALMEAVLAFVPPEERVKYSALTGQALYYLSDADLKHKILAIVEEEGAERASYALKLLQSEGELSIASTGKDPHTGRMVTQEYRVEGPVMIFLTTTAVDIDEELLNRCLVLTVDEGREQTAAIHKLQRERETLAGLMRSQTRNLILNTHRAAQRLLRPLAVVNPFAEQLTFLDDRTRTRRDHGKYLSLIRAIAFLHQYQRPVKTVLTPEGRTLAYIEATLADIAAANRLAHVVLGRCLDEMPPQTRRLLELIERMVCEKCGTSKMERGDVLFRARQLREFTGWGSSQLHVHLQRLVELEYVLTHRAEHGSGFVYELVYDGAGKDGGRFLPGLIDVEKLRSAQVYGVPSEATSSSHPGQKVGHPGVNGADPGHVRPLSGPLPGPVRGAETPDSSSENAAPVPGMAQNAHLDGAALVAAS